MESSDPDKRYEFFDFQHGVTITFMRISQSPTIIRDMQEWCETEFGPGADASPRSEMKTTLRWFIFWGDGRVIFRFRDDHDALLCKLRWG